jgi:hypothetical protein
MWLHGMGPHLPNLPVNWMLARLIAEKRDFLLEAGGSLDRLALPDPFQTVPRVVCYLRA